MSSQQCDFWKQRVMKEERDRCAMLQRTRQSPSPTKTDRRMISPTKVDYSTRIPPLHHSDISPSKSGVPPYVGAPVRLRQPTLTTSQEIGFGTMHSTNRSSPYSKNTTTQGTGS
eukprot:TRINITY_DN723_c0_g4_i1.p1 TRINITY_DN723_c0_g4~~TRINITY_DN723_c0_g4_i1.p1  ORF type:complete len:114 (-),score=21.13 TRINITY_DN723_c0_g4_i1:391-732(-)